jgi:hypothetical protein
MARYFFNVTDGEYIADDVGIEFASLDLAKAEAVELATRLLRDNATRFWQGVDWMIEVTDETGLILFSLTFMATESATLRASRIGRDGPE